MDRSSAFIKAIQAALDRKMVFLGGPRQVGKTSLALSLLGERAKPNHPGYLNWDDPRVPPRLRRAELPAEQSLIVLDEVHKYARWRNLVKGIHDTQGAQTRLLVTGSARLDHYRKGGDSLVGRYRHFRLHPFSLRELSRNPTRGDLERLMKWSGFPEPLSLEDETEWRIWQRDRLTRVVREDLRDLERVHEISLIEQLVDLLPARVGSPLSVKSLREDLGVDHKTAERWVTILENLYVCYRIAPFGAPKVRAVKKEKKLYLWDWSMVPDDGARFENLVASQLLKYCHWIEDFKGHRMELRFLRDAYGKEVDFVVLRNGTAEFAVECKTGEGRVAPAAQYFASRTPIPTFYQVHRGSRPAYKQGRVTVLSLIELCRTLDLP